jgi:hypothetical protein
MGDTEANLPYNGVKKGEGGGFGAVFTHLDEWGRITGDAHFKCCLIISPKKRIAKLEPMSPFTHHGSRIILKCNTSLFCPRSSTTPPYSPDRPGPGEGFRDERPGRVPGNLGW